MKARWLLIAVVVLVTGCDQGTKRWAETSLDSPRTLVAGRLDLELAHNPGIAFNAERALPDGARPVLLALVGCALLGFAAVWLARRPAWSRQSVGIALAIGGGLGNLVDRVARGSVIDFIHWHGWPVFNVADIAIAAGAVLILSGPAAPRSPTAAPRA
jgi:signal peptidase II